MFGSFFDAIEAVLTIDGLYSLLRDIRSKPRLGILIAVLIIAGVPAVVYFILR
jgi:hypothetical protein